MFGLGFGEILLLAAIGLIVLGPKQLPQVARVIGRTIGELKKALHDVTAQVAINLDEEHKRPKPPNNQHNENPGYSSPATPEVSAPPPAVEVAGPVVMDTKGTGLHPEGAPVIPPKKENS